MPLVISKDGLSHIPTEQVLAEILGHDDFDGEDWAIGDRIIFEDGTQAAIRREPGREFHTWDDPLPADFEEVKQIARVPQARDWKDLFASIARQSEEQASAAPDALGCGLIAFGTAIAAGIVLLLLQWLLSACSRQANAALLL